MSDIGPIWILKDNYSDAPSDIQLYATQAAAYRALAERARDGGLPDELWDPKMSDEAIAEEFLKYWDNECELESREVITDRA
ncbi:hypothetical protein MUG78_17805 [Gordonia alkaliphila]|uniref:hypothetical protein n=1 Tax=Gordonia alkaliphila TaxID=1053547 RepID=UPI001FF6353A|nr:hypothetical protein [Gordonia alkaliphila]MCK0441257.1 hypothetical protein [Gordonia alkaliphila]